MNATAQKLELIQWISNLYDIRLLNEVAAFRKRNQSKTQLPKRFFGCGKGIFGETPEDFNEPLDIFEGLLSHHGKVVSTLTTEIKFKTNI